MRAWILSAIIVSALQTSSDGAAVPQVLVDKTPVAFNGLAESEAAGPRRGSEFRIASDSTITGLRWWGVYVSLDPASEPPSDSFTLELFDIGEGGLVATTPRVELQPIELIRTQETNRPGSLSRYSYQAEFEGVRLPAGDYLLAIGNDSAALPGLTWRTYNRCDLCSLFSGYHQFSEGGPWERIGTEIGYQLIGVVPEPSTLLLACVGLVLPVTSSRGRR